MAPGVTPKSLLMIAALISAIPLHESAAGTKQAAPAAATPGTGSTPKENVRYGSAGGMELDLDVYESTSIAPDEKRPAVLLIHGGGWTSLDRSTMRRMGEFLARSGFVGFAVDYRLFQNKETRWPAQLDDVQRAVRWVRAHAAQYRVDPERIGAFGHSAGAQLAALLGMEDTRDNSDPTLAQYSSRVQAVVDVSGPTDFTVMQDGDGDGFLSNFFGSNYSTDSKIWREASPAFDVSRGDAPFLIVHGTQDEEVPISQSEELYNKLKSAGVPVSFVKVNDAHTFRTPEARRQLAIEALAFFNRYLAKKQ